MVVSQRINNEISTFNLAPQSLRQGGDRISTKQPVEVIVTPVEPDRFPRANIRADNPLRRAHPIALDRLITQPSWATAGERLCVSEGTVRCQPKITTDK